jgi:hypothetical protein
VIEKASLIPFDDNLFICVETDASGHTISAVLLQNQKAVAFFLRTLKPPELHLPSIEKEAAAIVESINHWRHFLLRHHFLFVTDQEAVAYIFNKKGKGRTKNDKLLRWRVELSYFTYDVKFRPGSSNLAADAVSRACASTLIRPNLEEIHNVLCHPGISCLGHYVRTRNLPYSMEDAKKVCNGCNVCRQLAIEH